MNWRPMLIVNGTLVAAMAAVSAWGWQAIPDGTLIPTNIDLGGKPNRPLGKEDYLLLMPVVGAALTAFFWIIPRFDPRRANIEASSKFWNVAAILSCGILAYTHALLVMAATGVKIDLASALVPGLSVLFIGLGNYLGKVRSNWFGGVRTMWTLDSEYSWEKSNRWGGRMMVASGLVSLAAWFVVEPKLAVLILVGLVTATAVLSIVLSYVFWRIDPNRTANGTH